MLADEIPLVLNPMQDVLWLVAYLIAFALVDLMLLILQILSHLLLFDVAKVLLAAVQSHLCEIVLTTKDSLIFLRIQAIRIAVRDGAFIQVILRTMSSSAL